MPIEKPDTETKQHGDQFPPTRPGLVTYLIAGGVIAGIAAITYWAEISNFLNLTQIRSSIGL